MKTFLLSLLAVATVDCACAQTLSPELQPAAAKYKADLAMLEGQRTTALAQAKAPYVAALAAAEKTATTAGNVAGVAAIATERTALSNGLMAPGLPADLPKELQMPRKTYLDTFARIRAAEAPRLQMIDAAYLRALTDLESRAAKNPELAKEIADEKQKLLASAPATNQNKTNSKNVVANGTFDAADAEGHPSGWTPAEGYKVTRDGTNAVLHASAKAPVYQAMSQDILLPAKARNVTLSGRIRGKIAARDTTRSQTEGAPGVFLAAQYVDKNDAPTANWILLDGGSDTRWKAVKSANKIPDGMKILRVALVLKWVAGEFDYDDIEVEFR